MANLELVYYVLLVQDQWNSLLMVQCGCRAGVARRLVPFCAVAAADVLNLGITRRDEYLEGIRVYDDNNELVGQSRLAGLRAVSACTAGRIFAAAPILVVPSLVMHRYSNPLHLHVKNEGFVCFSFHSRSMLHLTTSGL